MKIKIPWYCWPIFVIAEIPRWISIWVHALGLALATYDYRRACDKAGHVYNEEGEYCEDCIKQPIQWQAPLTAHVLGLSGDFFACIGELIELPAVVLTHQAQLTYCLKYGHAKNPLTHWCDNCGHDVFEYPDNEFSL